MNTGSCHCGAVEYEVPRALGDVKFCYCQTCRKLNGTAFSAVALVDAGEFKLLKGESSLEAYESSAGKFRYHCKTCFAPIYVKLASRPEQVRIRLGLLNFEPEVTLTGHIWVSQKPGWYTIADKLPQSQEF